MESRFEDGPSHSLATAVIALLAVGCSYTTATGNDDRVIRSVSTKQPPMNVRFRASVEVTQPSTINVRVEKQSFCAVSEEQTIARTVVTDRKPAAWSAPAAALGVLVTGLGLVVDYKVARGTPTDSGDKFTVGDAVYIHTVGAVAIGQYLIARLMSGHSEASGGELKKVVDHPNESCGEEPAAGIQVRLENSSSGVPLQLRTDELGQAKLTVDDDEPAFKKGWTCEAGGCAPPSFQVFVAGSKLGVASLSGLRALEKTRGIVQAAYQSEQAKESDRRRREHEEQQRGYERFREHVAVGDETHCGMIIEIKKPIVKVQTLEGEKWFRLPQLFPPGQAPCRFFNHEYVDLPLR